MWLPGGLLPAKHPREALLNLFEAPGVDHVLAVDHPGQLRPSEAPAPACISAAVIPTRQLAQPGGEE